MKLIITFSLKATTQLAFERYCKAKGITKTQALERGIKLLLQEEYLRHHSSYSAFLRMQDRLTAKKLNTERKNPSISRQQKAYLDAKYSS